MSRIVTVLVVVMILVAGCSGAPTGGDDTESDDSDVENITTYVNESGASTFVLEANHDTKTYNMSMEGTFQPPYGTFEKESAIRIYCGALEESAYQYSPDPENASNFTKISPTGETETVRGIPEHIMTEYEPKKVQATTYAANGTELASCTVNGEGDITYSD